MVYEEAGGTARSLKFFDTQRPQIKKNLFRLLALTLLAFALFGCGKATTNDFTQTQSGITAVFRITPDSPAMMEPATLSLSLTDANGTAVEGAQVTYDLTMPGMMMPPNQPQATDEGNGVYTSEATFTMSGDWRTEVSVTYKDKMIPFTFDFSVK